MMTESAQKILFVDDDLYQRQSMKKMLDHLGYAVECATSARDALKIIKTATFQLIITDLIMPGMDGTELCQHIRTINPDAVIYAFSGHLTKFDLAQLEASGFDGHLCKPVDKEKLKRSIEGAFSKIALKRKTDFDESG